MKLKNWIRIFLSLAILLLSIFPIITALAAPAFDEAAYLDPGSGSILTQLIIAAILGSLVAIKAYWSKIKGIFRKSEKESPKQNENITE